MELVFQIAIGIVVGSILVIAIPVQTIGEGIRRRWKRILWIIGAFIALAVVVNVINRLPRESKKTKFDPDLFLETPAPPPAGFTPDKK